MALVAVLWTACTASQTKTIVEFTRAWDTCDTQDVEIRTEGTTRLVYAKNDDTPNPNPAKHTTRGTQSIRLASPGESTFSPPEKDVQTFDVKFNKFKVPFDDPYTGKDTTYYCGAFKLPSPTQKVHIIRFEPLILPASNLGTVHHILLYECHADAKYDGVRGHCHSGGLPPEVANCNGGTTIAGWAIGGVGFTYPNHIGYPVTSAGPNFVLMEVHYNNPSLREVEDESGFRFYYTNELRQYDAGIFAVGHFTESIFRIPPQLPSYTVDSWCPNECTKNLPHPINLVGTLMHAHLAGRAIRLRHIRNHRELPPILTDINYDFNFQDFEAFSKEVTVLPGDELFVQCTYNTMDRTAPTPFGLTTHMEMCLTYNIYYPKVNFTASCQSGNYTETPYPDQGTGVACADSWIPRAQILPFTPITPVPCVHKPPPANRTTPKIGSVKDFNPLKYKYNSFLDDSKQFKLYWTPDVSEIRFAVEANSSGWVGLGISPNGGMVGSDVAISWVDDQGQPQHADRYATARSLPVVDTLQDHYDITIRKG